MSQEEKKPQWYVGMNNSSHFSYLLYILKIKNNMI